MTKRIEGNFAGLPLASTPAGWSQFGIPHVVNSGLTGVQCGNSGGGTFLGGTMLYPPSEGAVGVSVVSSAATVGGELGTIALCSRSAPAATANGGFGMAGFFLGVNYSDLPHTGWPYFVPRAWLADGSYWSPGNGTTVPGMPRWVDGGRWWIQSEIDPTTFLWRARAWRELDTVPDWQFAATIPASHRGLIGTGAAGVHTEYKSVVYSRWRIDGPLRRELGARTVLPFSSRSSL